ncbi:hypothetical protein N7519_005155 [Penicillium mononematosum]|uniref:uncharacterized protein n=1 Tax=Penicillium mononematosum TaxID=268346 RepID=UPI002548452B|nr:uncharacterized protein N7519_005155 [Penicillium mononematosum]KAJ6183854.1 hypothetical protein N7519_005155 [Penicillium mononematosum]
MAPSLEEPVVTVAPTTAKFTVPVLAEDLAGDNKFGYQPGRTPVTQHDNYAYEDFLPSFPDIHWAPLEYTPYQDKGLRGDPKFRNILRDATAVFDLNPKIGTEIHGVDLAKLDDAQRDDLARLIAYRGVVFFRSQKNFDIEAQRQLGQYWGKLHKHATTSVPRKPGLEDVHVVYTGDNSGDNRALFTPSFLWHSDVTYEIQPPSYTSLKLLSGPPPRRRWRHPLVLTIRCLRYTLLAYAKLPQRPHGPSLSRHASQRLPGTRPAITGWNGLFFNPGFVKKIVGIPAAESDAIIRFLTDVIATTQEMHARFSWGEEDVAIWDNRSTNHSASYGFTPHRRHAVRVAVHAEKPVLKESGKSQEDELNALYGLPTVNKDGSRQSNYND